MGRAKRLVRQVSARRRTAAGPADGATLWLEQPPNRHNVPRYGHGEAPPHPGLARIISAHDDQYAALVDALATHREALLAIRREDGVGLAPSWTNPMFIGLDGAALYRFLRTRQPRTYLEIGSGYSTRFAAQAKRDGGLATRIVSIDPEPRAEVDALCDEVLRRPLEEVDLDRFASLEAGDVLFFDGSHRVFMHNDVAVFWLDVLPRVPPGVLCGIHDVWLPEDYPPGHAEKYWSEHYLLAVALLFGDTIRPVLACHHVCTDPQLSARLNRLWDEMGLAGLNAYGSAFWFERVPAA